MTNRGSKMCIKRFSARLLSAVQNEKMVVCAEEITAQVISRGNEHIYSVSSMSQTSFKYIASASSNVNVQWEGLLEPEVSFKLTLIVSFSNFANKLSFAISNFH